MSLLTTDLCDAHEDMLADGRLRVLPPLFQSYGALTRISGPAITLKLHEDNALVRAALEQPGEGRVLVVDGGGSLRCALVGGNLAAMAAKNGWAGILVHGSVRDSVEINACAIGVRALGTHPQKSIKKGAGDVNLRVCIAGVTVAPGEWIYADEDGVLVSSVKLG